eukprot:5957105-Pyramimonas_sp.AAC.1
MTPGLPKTLPRLPKIATQYGGDAHDGPKTAHDTSNWFQYGSKRAQEGHKDSSNMALRLLNVLPKVFRTTQCASNSVH